MNIENAIELLSLLESQIQRQLKDPVYNCESYGTVAIYKDMLQISKFIDDSSSNDYTTKCMIKKFNDIKNVMACELYKKFLLLDFNKDFYINTEILSNVNVIYGNLYRNTLINEFCFNSIKHLTNQIETPNMSQYIIKLSQLFENFIDSDKVDMFPNDWNISYYLYVEFKKCITNNIKKIKNILFNDIVIIGDNIRNLENHISQTFIKRCSAFSINETICNAFDENQYIYKLYTEKNTISITKFKDFLNANFNVNYNTGNTEFIPNYNNIIQPYTTSIDLFNFVKKTISDTEKISSGKILKNLLNDLLNLIMHYGNLLMSTTNKQSEFENFNIIATTYYCSTIIENMHQHFKLLDDSTNINKTKLFFSEIFSKTTNNLIKNVIEKIKYFSKDFIILKFDQNKKEQNQDLW